MKNKKIAVFPGSFDPVTVGHESLVLKALPLFDTIIVAIGNNVLKQYLFGLEQRKKWIEWVFREYPTIKTAVYEGLTVDFCRKVGATYIIRGLRTSADFEYERNISQANKLLYKDLETVFLLSSPEHTPVTSSIVRDIFRNNGDTSKFVPQGVVLTI
ncbi:MAG: pantetheine-phosphate adenylyltransferase [Bacteroidales bacterium]|jgi:pantetheine-phosphate adenylyltransferase|nr:pantetheine-phosphate adenylyltransferase [Bacteroidales bacterium]MCK9447782.1 pantetheine-phosphate adenylyltransferase [Bacteroidales bacterium]MDD3700111.1 pantetheine-phosphate adenylyltransferase [Bacteroidales bacterium]MDY0369065.1 pantetheine-phosphate adenylyltransferase [Bacteroidales bacterium]